MYKDNLGRWCLDWAAASLGAARFVDGRWAVIAALPRPAPPTTAPIHIAFIGPFGEFVKIAHRLNEMRNLVRTLYPIFLEHGEFEITFHTLDARTGLEDLEGRGDTLVARIHPSDGEDVYFEGELAVCVQRFVTNGQMLHKTAECPIHFPEACGKSVPFSALELEDSK